MNAEENTDINYPSENSPLLQIREDINHDSNKEAQDGNLKNKNSLYEMSNLSYLPEEYCHQHKKVGLNDLKENILYNFLSINAEYLITYKHQFDCFRSTVLTLFIFFHPWLN